MVARRFEDLEVWQKARELTKIVYEVTKGSEFDRDIRLKNQMRDSTVSIMANIAEGFNRNSSKEFARFLYIAKSSGAELQSHSYVALDQHYLATDKFHRLYESVDHISRMSTNLIKYLKSRASKTPHNA